MVALESVCINIPSGPDRGSNLMADPGMGPQPCWDEYKPPNLCGLHFSMHKTDFDFHSVPARSGIFQRGRSQQWLRGREGQSNAVGLFIRFHLANLD